MATSDLPRLQHMLDACGIILDIAKNVTKKQFESDIILISAAICQLQILGEAANAVSKQTQSRFPMIPWKGMIGMRHRLIHGYFEIDTNMVWLAISESVPSVIKQIQAAISELSS